MLKWLIGLLASVSSIFINGANKSNVTPPLNTAIIAYQETYYVPVVADLGNFPWPKKISSEVQTLIAKPTPAKPTPLPAPLPTPPPPPPPAPILPPAPVSDPYLANPEPIVNWYVPVIFRGNSTDGNSTLPEMTFDREFWRIEVLAYWAPGALSKTSVEKDYFKLEVYEKGTDKLIYTMTSGTEETIHKFQAFKKSGTYYFKTYLKNPSQFEMTFTFH